MAKKRGRPLKPGPRTPSGFLSRANQLANMSTVLEARARHAHLEATEAVILTMKAPWYGCVAGRRIAGETDVQALWDTVQTIRARRRAWLMSIGAAEHPMIARMELLPEPQTADDAPVADTRTEGERAEAADRNWHAIVMALFPYDPDVLRFLEAVVCRDEDRPGPLAQVLRMKPLREALGR